MDEATLELTARGFIDTLRETAGLGPDDVVLEIGCGIARVGKPLSRECLHWFGADISGGMLAHAAARLGDCPNTTLVELATVGLQEFPRDAFDLVYCTIVFMHLFEWDRYRYVEEAYRVLRPGGRCYFDNFPLDSEHGWKVFSEGAQIPGRPQAGAHQHGVDPRGARGLPAQGGLPGRGRQGPSQPAYRGDRAQAGLVQGIPPDQGLRPVHRQPRDSRHRVLG